MKLGFQLRPVIIANLLGLCPVTERTAIKWRCQCDEMGVIEEENITGDLDEFAKFGIHVKRGPWPGKIT